MLATPLPWERGQNLMKKRDLPSKCCPACGREFVWRRKWQRDWDQVRWCSDACRRGTPRGRAKPG